MNMATKKKIRAAVLDRSISEHDCNELAAHILGINSDNDSYVECELFNRFGCTMNEFTDLIRALLPMAGMMKSELTDTWYQVFAVIEKDGSAMALVKRAVDPKNQQNYK